jgi:CBS domain-containing protein
MTPLAQLTTVGPTMPGSAAHAIAAEAGVHHLLVLDQERRLVGITCRCDLARAGAADVAAVMSRDVFATGPSTPLAAVTAAMRLLGVGCLPVVDEGLVLGLLTRADLQRAGAPT